jgi:hypothetical protein
VRHSYLSGSPNLPSNAVIWRAGESLLFRSGCAATTLSRIARLSPVGVDGWLTSTKVVALKIRGFGGEFTFHLGNYNNLVGCFYRRYGDNVRDRSRVEPKEGGNRCLQSVHDAGIAS